MSLALISFPVSFGDRECDREFVMRLMSRGGVGREAAEMVLFRMWFGFGKGKGPSVKVGEFTDMVIAEWCQWQGDAKILIEAAMNSGFLKREKLGEDETYLLVGFSEANRGSLSNATSKGGKLRWAGTNLKKSRKEAGELFKLMSALEDPVVKEDPELAERGMVIGVNLCRSVGIELPTKDDFKNGFLRKCKEVAREFDDDQMGLIYRYIMLNKADEAIVPRDRDLLCVIDRLRGYSKIEV